MTRNSSISAFFPCYNDSKSITRMVEDALKTLKELTSDYEVIVIDDGSEDNSRDVLKELGKKYKKLKLVFQKKNKGYGGALKSGFKTASKDLVFYTDGDGQFDISEMKILHLLLTPDVDFVNGTRMIRQDAGYRVFAGNLHRFINRWAFFLPVIDVDSDYRLIRRDILKKIKLESNTGSICIELVKKAERARARFREVDVHHFERPYGRSQFFRLDRIVKTYIELAFLWVRLMVVDKFFV